jgi:threonine dehydrogenase-like Zn-dependent dehydrogenase
VEHALHALTEAARTGEGNLLDLGVKAVRARATVGEVSEALEKVWGRYRATNQVISGVYGAPTDPLPMFQLFDKQVQIRMGQANVRRWSDDILDLLQQDEDVLGVDSFATHHLPLEDAPEAYRKFRDKEDGMVKVVFKP